MKEHEKVILNLCYEIEGLEMDVKSLKGIVQKLTLENHNLKKSLTDKCNGF